MKNKLNLFAYILLILLTISTSFISKEHIANSTTFILILSAVKFLIVGFIFMELRKAHIVWKAAFSVFTVFYLLVVLII